MRYRNAAFLVLFFHAALALHAAWHLSPVWDEIVYPAAGYDLLVTGRLRTSLDHPPLGKMLLAFPLFLQGTRLQTASPETTALEPFHYGFDFVYHNRRPARWLIFLPRVMAVALSCLLGLLLWSYARGLWGEAAALVTLALYAFLPPVLSRASLALLEMPLALFMTAALLSAARWRARGERWALALWVLSWMAALLTKANALILFPAFFLADALARPSDKKEIFRRWAQTFAAGCVVLGGCELMLRGFGQSYWIGQILARQKDLMSSRFPIYFHGSAWDAALFYMAPCAWLIKTPLPFTVLAAAGWWCWRRAKPKEETFILLSSTLILTGLQMASVRSIIATGQYFILWPLCALLAAAVVSSSFWRPWVVGVLAGSVALSAVWVHPQYLAYFNLLAGGSRQGYHWLSDSDQDWGQGLPALAAWMRQEKMTQIILGFSGAGDPRIYGIAYQDLISPALLTPVYRGEIFQQWPGRVVLALGTKVAQTEGDLLEWLLAHRRPVTQVGETFLIYDFTQDPEGTAVAGVALSFYAAAAPGAGAPAFRA